MCNIRVGLIKKVLFIFGSISAIVVITEFHPKNTEKTNINMEECRMIYKNDKFDYNINDDLEETYTQDEEYITNDAKINGTTVNRKDETIVSNATSKVLKRLLKCNNRYFESETKMRGDYWVLQNYAKAGHGPIDCYRYVTLVTEGDYTFSDNLEVLVKRWQAPISIALFGPGTDFDTVVHTMRYLKDCSPVKDLINHWVSFHIFFPKNYVPYTILYLANFSDPCDCSKGKPGKFINPKTTYRIRKNIWYPINVGRNIGRDAALTHYFLSLDIELYPIPKLGARFLNMLARNTSYITGDRPRVYVLKPFEVGSNLTIPENKTALQRMLQEKTAKPFHKSMCYKCHQMPCTREWSEQAETPYMDVTGVGKRIGPFEKWEPFFISTHSLPYLEERFLWDGRRDKMTQAYVLCLMDYDFLILSNAFVAHHRGFRNYLLHIERESVEEVQNDLLDETLQKELKAVYGERTGCVFK